MCDRDTIRTVDGRTERLLLEMPAAPHARDAALIMQTAAAAYPMLKLSAFVKGGPDAPLQVWVPVDAEPAEVDVSNRNVSVHEPTVSSGTWAGGQSADVRHDQAWVDATTLHDLGEATARWLERTLAYHPVSPYSEDGPDPETDGLIELLAAANRQGFVTTWSQPGVKKGRLSQRAHVSGVCSEEMFVRLRDAAEANDLIVLACAPGQWHTTDLSYPVTQVSATNQTWAGRFGQVHDEFAPYPAASRILAACWEIDIVDPRWGRNNRLWPVLIDTLNLNADLRWE